MARSEKNWRLEPQANGTTALVLEEALPTQAGDARSISYWVVLPEPLGRTLTESTRRNRDVMVERLIGEGVRVHGLEDGL